MPESQPAYTYRNGEKVPLEKRGDQFVVCALHEVLQDVGLDNTEKVSSASSRVTVPHDESEAAASDAWRLYVTDLVCQDVGKLNGCGLR